MKAVSVVLVPRELFSVVLGITSASAVMSGIACFSSSAPEMEVTAPGTSWINSARRRAVTTTLSISRLALSVVVGGRLRVCRGPCHGGDSHDDRDRTTQHRFLFVRHTHYSLLRVVMFLYAGLYAMQRSVHGLLIV